MTASRVGYWTTTAIVALELLVGGEWDLAHYPYVAHIVQVLGYPAYLLTILGAWKVLGGIVLFVPGYPRLKEWAYAGTFFEMTGAAASHLAAGDNPVNAMVPAVFAALTLISWALRPPGRTLVAPLPAK